MNLSSTELLDEASDILASARAGIALTGAGISTPSGIPDFRSSSSGLWENVDPMVVASITGFRRNPEAFFAWIRPLAGLMRGAQPNAAHHALAKLETLGAIRAVITQNIDMLHSKAGSRFVLEAHGQLREATCGQCFTIYLTEIFLEAFIASGEIPRCAACGGILKPNVILFGEQLPTRTLREAEQAARECDVMLVAGTSLEVAPVSELPALALTYGAKLIIVNNAETHMDRQASVVIRGDVSTVLPNLTARVEGLYDQR